jgi:hypothetical protein
VVEETGEKRWLEKSDSAKTRSANESKEADEDG